VRRVAREGMGKNRDQKRCFMPLCSCHGHTISARLCFYIKVDINLIGNDEWRSGTAREASHNHTEKAMKSHRFATIAVLVFACNMFVEAKEMRAQRPKLRGYESSTSRAHSTRRRNWLQASRDATAFEAMI